MSFRFMTSVFFSHSKYDRNLINYFSNIFTHIGLQGRFFEWQEVYSNYAGMTISNIIRHPDTVAVSAKKPAIAVGIFGSAYSGGSVVGLLVGA
jgi:hypothetical protein